MTSTQTRSQVERAVALARAEQTSGEIFGKDWWDFTRFLGSVTGSNREISDVYNAVAGILSVDKDKPISHSYLGSRRSLARKIHSEVYRTRMYYKLPTRVSLEWSAVAGKDAVLDIQAARKLIEFEASGKSLRDIYEILDGGRGKPKSWQNAAERAAAESEIRAQVREEVLSDDDTILAQLEQRPQLVQRAVQEKPQVRRRIVEDVETRVALNREHNELARERTKDMDLTFVDDKKNQFLQAADIAADIARLGDILGRIRRTLRDHAPDYETRSSYAGSLVAHAEKVNELVGSLRGDAEFEMMMVREGLA